MKILVADDLEESRFILSNLLRQLGHTIVSARDGVEALAILESTDITFLISDWMMPNLSGIDLVKKIRSSNFPRYVYTIILTAKTGKDELIEGMESGADDFITKPYNPQELKVRVNAGMRILSLEQKLKEKNSILEESNRKLNDVYTVMKKDLEAAATMQRDLLPKKNVTLSGYTFDHLFIPCSYVAGDIFDYYHIDEDYIGFYQLDVAGHGIPAAMLSFTLSKYLNPYSLQRELLFNKEQNLASSPAAILKKLNDTFNNEEDAMQFFTILFGILHIPSGNITIARGGHPHPILLRKGKKSEKIDPKGIPLGMFAHYTCEEYSFILKPNDRLVIFSDGIIDSMNKDMSFYSSFRLESFLELHADKPVPILLELLNQELADWRGKPETEDDMSLVIIEKTD